VYLITSKDEGILFDLDNDEFLKLDPIATRMWTLLSAGKSREEAASVIAQECEVDMERVLGDLQNLLASAASRDIRPEYVRDRRTETGNRRGTLQTFPWYGKQVDIARPRVGPFAVARAFLTLAWFDLSLSTRCLKSVCRLVSKWPMKLRKARSLVESIGQTCIAVERACVWYPKKALCLQRSAVTTCLLRSCGVGAKLVIGVRPMPFCAHAWVEVDGSVVNDFPTVTRFYQPVSAF